jgi:hypothetical protein
VLPPAVEAQMALLDGPRLGSQARNYGRRPSPPQRPGEGSTRPGS